MQLDHLVDFSLVSFDRAVIFLAGALKGIVTAVQLFGHGMALNAIHVLRRMRCNRTKHYVFA